MSGTHEASAVTSAPWRDAASAERVFRRALLLTAGVKLILAILVPFTTDEAYFVVWGRNLDYGYYDHGAMTGWWLWLMLQIGDAAWWLRLPAILVSQFVGWCLWRMLRPLDACKAAWAATLYLVLPVNLLNVLITTDTPLLFFSTLAVLGVYQGIRRERFGYFLLAGLALGFAFLSKYFAVLLGIAFAVVLLFASGRPRWRELLVLLGGIIPGVGINVAWNYHHNWTNVLFNLITRQEPSGPSVVTPVVFVIMLLALAGPAIVIALFRRHHPERLPWRAAWATLRRDGTVVPAGAFLVPVVVLGLVAFTHEIGVHWVLSFFPFLVAGLFTLFSVDGLVCLLRPTAIYSAVPAVLVAVATLLPVEWARNHRSYASIVLAVRPQWVLAELAPYREQYVLTTPSYAKSALLGYYDGRNVPVIGPGSFHGRQDDLLTDFRAFAGRDLMIVTNRERDIRRAGDWFARIEVKELPVHDAGLFLVLGEDFQYDVYRDQVLQEIANRYYWTPPWLRPFAAPSFFTERYGLVPREPHPVADE